MVEFKLLEPNSYYESLLEEIPKAKKRVIIASMALLWGERTEPIFKLLQDAIKRGVKVTVLLDSYTKMTYLLGLKPPSSGKKRLRQTYRALEELSLKGAKVHSFGKVGLVPHKGRCHIKAIVVDNSAYAFGGINLYDEQFDNTDYMLTGKKPALADYLARLVDEICATRPPLPDDELVVDEHTRILFDGGRPKQSLIYERACELTSQAKRVYFAGQMVPSGELVQLLNETKATVYTNRPEQMRPLESVGQSFDQQRYRVTNLYTGKQFIHSKMMLFEMPGGRKALLSGSHNFSYRGVSYGTQEVALHSTDPKLWKQLYSYIEKNIIKPKLS